MNLSAKFVMTNASRIVPLRSLEVNVPYTIMHAERAVTRFGATIALTITKSPSDVVKVYLPRRYASLFSEGDIEDLNAQRALSQILVYQGLCEKTKAHLLEIKSSTVSN